MQHNAAFHQGLHFNYNPTPLDMDYLSLLYQTRRKNPLAYKGSAKIFFFKGCLNKGQVHIFLVFPEGMM